MNKCEYCSRFQDNYGDCPGKLVRQMNGEITRPVIVSYDGCLNFQD